jgi:hypothetical protein
MPLPLIINSIVCVLGTVIGVLFVGASIISIANMTVSWRGLLLIAALLVPVVFAVSGIGLWLVYERTALPVVIGLVALPWLYGSVFVLLMLVSFDS